MRFSSIRIKAVVLIIIIALLMNCSINKISKNVNFSEEYIKIHKDKIDIEIPMMYELAHIIVAISKIGLIDSNLIYRHNSYYKEMLRYFSKYKKHSLIKIIEKNITNVIGSGNSGKSSSYFYSLIMNACGYIIDDNGKIRHDGIITKMGWSKHDPIDNNLHLFQYFVKVSSFIQFYENQLSYYNYMLEQYKKTIPVEKMCNWLEKKFSINYDYYRVVLSPIGGGLHCTEWYEDNNFRQNVIFISYHGNNHGYNDNVNEMIESRVVFTEINHGFVNPVSDRYLTEIDKSFGKREIWVLPEDLATIYNSAYSIFNEYMTWAVFTLYCYDTYPLDDVKEFMQIMEKQMVSSRFFIKFPEFNQKLLSIYIENHDSITIDGLYKAIFEWCGAQLIY